MQPVYTKRRSALDQRSVIIILILLLLGAALGFGAGYKYEKHAKSGNAKGTTVAAAAAARQRQAVARRKARMINCMATKGVKYASMTADISRPPAGVAHDAYQAALVACSKTLPAQRSG